MFTLNFPCFKQDVTNRFKATITRPKISKCYQRDNFTTVKTNLQKWRKHRHKDTTEMWRINNWTKNLEIFEIPKQTNEKQTFKKWSL